MNPKDSAELFVRAFYAAAGAVGLAKPLEPLAVEVAEIGGHVRIPDVGVAVFAFDRYVEGRANAYLQIAGNSRTPFPANRIDSVLPERAANTFAVNSPVEIAEFARVAVAVLLGSRMPDAETLARIAGLVPPPVAPYIPGVVTPEEYQGEAPPSADIFGDPSALAAYVRRTLKGRRAEGPRSAEGDVRLAPLPLPFTVEIRHDPPASEEPLDSDRRMHLREDLEADGMGEEEAEAEADRILREEANPDA